MIFYNRWGWEMVKKFGIILCVVGMLIAWGIPSHAGLIDVTDSSLPHFGDFVNQDPNTANYYSKI